LLRLKNGRQARTEKIVKNIHEDLGDHEELNKQKQVRKALEVHFWNAWDEPSCCDHMNLVTSVTWSRHGVSREVMYCSVTYDYVVLGNRVGVIDQIFFRPEPLRIIIAAAEGDAARSVRDGLVPIGSSRWLSAVPRVQRHAAARGNVGR